MKSNKLLIVIAVLLLCVSVSLMLYPTLSQFVNKMFDKNSIVQYDNQVSVLDSADKEYMINKARNYNDSLTNVVSISDSFSPDAFNVDDSYENILRVTNDGLIGSVSIPKINCNLPIYHGTTEDVLDKGAVHMANTSFPVGGASTHAVVSAHTAYPGKEFFNRLTELELGDYFYLKVLGDTLVYKVNQINVVLPTDSQLLSIEKGEDLVTLVTCTPYSVNTHRLLVRGQRDLEEEARLNATDTIINENNNSKDKTKVYIIIGVSVILTVTIIIFVILIAHRKRKKNDEE